MTDDAPIPDDLEPRLERALRLDPSAREAEVAALIRTNPAHADVIRAYVRLGPDTLDETDATVPAEPDDSEDADGTPRELGPYRIERRLGRGGQGDVFLARDTRLGRKVALKILRHITPEGLRRFQREAAVSSRLDHPGICTVYDSGRIDGFDFIAMRYIDGESLAELLQRARFGDRRGGIELPEVTPGVGSPSGTTVALHGSGTRAEVARILHLFERCARALHIAHEAGLVHRDIKPGNILVTRDGEPVLLDFGLARDDHADADSLQTSLGAIIGTPDYMAPEQVAPTRDGSRRIDRRTDVWSLAATLWECLTLHKPYEASDWASRYQRILREGLPNPGRWNPVVGRDLRAVLEKALEREPAQRYADAAAFAEELRRVRENEPIHARPAGRVTRIAKWARRNPALAGAFAVLVALVLGLSVAIVQVVRTTGELSRARAREAQADLQRIQEAAVARATATNLAAAGALEGALEELEHARTLGYEDTAALALDTIDVTDGLGRHQDARTLLRALPPDVYEGEHAARALLLGGILGDDDAAGERPTLQQALEFGTLGPADASYVRALLAGDTGEARMHIAAALTAEPRHRRARELEGLLLLSAGEFDALFDHTAEWLALRPQEAMAVVLHAIVLQQRGEAAQAFLERAHPAVETHAFLALSDYVSAVRLVDQLDIALRNALLRTAAEEDPEQRRRGLRTRIQNILPMILPNLMQSVLAGVDAVRTDLGARLPVSLARRWNTFGQVFVAMSTRQISGSASETELSRAIATLPEPLFLLMRGLVREQDGEVDGAFDDYAAAAEGERERRSLFDVSASSQLFALRAHTARFRAGDEEARASARRGGTACIDTLLTLGFEPFDERRVFAHGYRETRLLALDELAESVALRWSTRHPGDPRAWAARAELALDRGFVFLAGDLLARAATLAPEDAEIVRLRERVSAELAKIRERGR